MLNTRVFFISIIKVTTKHKEILLFSTLEHFYAHIKKQKQNNNKKNRFHAKIDLLTFTIGLLSYSEKENVPVTLGIQISSALSFIFWLEQTVIDFVFVWNIQLSQTPCAVFFVVVNRKSLNSIARIIQSFSLISLCICIVISSGLREDCYLGY